MMRPGCLDREPGLPRATSAPHALRRSRPAFLTMTISPSSTQRPGNCDCNGSSNSWENSDSAASHRGSESGCLLRRGTPTPETHPTSARRASLRPSAFRQLVWRASARSAGSLENARLMLYHAPRRQGPFAATWDMTCQLGGGGSQVSRQQGWRRLRRLTVIARPRRGWYENRPPPGEIFVLCENLFRCSINSCSSVESRSRCLEWRPEIVAQKKTRSQTPRESRDLMVNL